MKLTSWTSTLLLCSAFITHCVLEDDGRRSHYISRRLNMALPWLTKDEHRMTWHFRGAPLLQSSCSPSHCALNLSRWLLPGIFLPG